MSFKIVIEDHVPEKTIYFPGDTVLGVLYLNGPIHDKNLEIVIQFRGRSCVALGTDVKEHEDNRILFHCQKSLYEGPIDLIKTESVPWEFKFEIPTHTQADASIHSKGWRDYKEDVLYISSKQQTVLPPSAQGHAHGAYSDVCYDIYAEAKRTPSWKCYSNLTQSANLTLRRRSPPHSPLPCSTTQFFTLAYRAPAGAISRLRGVKKLCAVLRQKCDAQLTVRATLPSVLELDRPVSSMQMSFEYEAFGNMNAVEMPPVMIRAVEFQIQAITSLRLPGQPKEYQPGSSYPDTHRRAVNTQNFDSGVMDRWWREGETLELGRRLEIVLEERKWASSFVGVNVARMYKCDLLVLLDIGGRRWQVRVEQEGQLLVLPPRREGGLAGQKAPLSRKQYLSIVRGVDEGSIDD